MHTKSDSSNGNIILVCVIAAIIFEALIQLGVIK